MRPPTENIGFLIFEVARLMRRRTDQAFERAGLGLTSGEARTLAYAATFEGLRQTSLAELMSIEPMTLVGFLDKLEARGLVERLPDPDDRRAKLIRVTPNAGPIIERVMEIAAATRCSATQGMAPEAIEQLRQALKLMRSNLMTDDREPQA
ncbi:MarR family winged helix-turn-helix transcriptional regulator [Rhodoligotrophos ferricapiens]|uniref:MarR family winged helix-turn-helix transcriptional regulator n=1 Tax=Rhodoligotrophos ferricapiens TaxID=3069264 RepID=UPI00315DFD96